MERSKQGSRTATAALAQARGAEVRRQQQNSETGGRAVGQAGPASRTSAGKQGGTDTRRSVHLACKRRKWWNMRPCQHQRPRQRNFSHSWVDCSKSSRTKRCLSRRHPERYGRNCRQHWPSRTGTHHMLPPPRPSRHLSLCPFPHSPMNTTTLSPHHDDTRIWDTHVAYLAPNRHLVMTVLVHQTTHNKHQDMYSITQLLRVLSHVTTTPQPLR